jgi:hypothetical protein
LPDIFNELADNAPDTVAGPLARVANDPDPADTDPEVVKLLQFIDPCVEVPDIFNVDPVMFVPEILPVDAIDVAEIACKLLDPVFVNAVHVTPCNDDNPDTPIVEVLIFPVFVKPTDVTPCNDDDPDTVKFPASTMPPEPADNDNPETVPEDVIFAVDIGARNEPVALMIKVSRLLLPNVVLSATTKLLAFILFIATLPSVTVPLTTTSSLNVLSPLID